MLFYKFPTKYINTLRLLITKRRNSMKFKSQNIYEGFKYPLKVGVCDVNTPSNICVLLFLIWHVRLFDFSVYPQPQIPLFPNPAIKQGKTKLRNKS